MLRAVLDANVYASALVKPDGPPGRILHILLTDRSFEVVLSRSILVELRRCIDYPKLRKYIPLIKPDTPPAIHLNTDILAKYREEMKKYYYDPTKYGTYLEQLGIKYPTLRTGTQQQ